MTHHTPHTTPARQNPMTPEEAHHILTNHNQTPDNTTRRAVETVWWLYGNVEGLQERVAELEQEVKDREGERNRLQLVFDINEINLAPWVVAGILQPEDTWRGGTESISIQEAAELLASLSEVDGPPWVEVGPQEHGQSDVDTQAGRHGPFDRGTAELMAAAPNLVHTVVAQGMEARKLYQVLAVAGELFYEATGHSLEQQLEIKGIVLDEQELP